MQDAIKAALKRFRTFADAAPGKPGLTVRFEEFPPVPSEELDDWEAVVGEEIDENDYAIPPELREFYACTGGLDLQWSIERDDAANLSGGCSIKSIFELYQHDVEADRPIKESIAIARPFDVVTDSAFAAILFKESAFKITNVMYIDTDRNLKKLLNHTPASYFVEAAAHLAIFGWQLDEQAPEDEALVTALVAT